MRMAPRHATASAPGRNVLKEDLQHQRLAGLFALALMLFNFPLLALWDRAVTVFGIPLFPLALFVTWALLIACLAWLMESSPD